MAKKTGGSDPETSCRVPEVVYHPRYKETQLVRFRKFVEEQHNVKLNDYWEFHEWSYKNFPEFWDSVWKFFDVVCSQPYTEVYDRRQGFDNMTWFHGVRMNFAQNVLKYRDSKTAIIATDEKGNDEYVSYRELYDEVRVYVAALKASGIGKGDPVACCMTNKKEAIFALLATAALGALWCSILPLLGSKAVIARLEQIKPKVLFVGGVFAYQKDGTKHEDVDRMTEIVSASPCLQKVLYVPTKSVEEEAGISKIPKCVALSKYLEEFRTAVKGNLQELEFEQVPFDHPFCISFTSGTTGPPKGLIHSTGMFLATLKDFGIHQDITREDILLTTSPGGWITWNMFVNTLHLGVTLVLYEGRLFLHNPAHFYDLIDKFGVTSTFVMSCFVEKFEKTGCVPTSKHTLKTLKELKAIGSPLKPGGFDFVAKKIKKGLFCGPAYGTTEFFSLISGQDTNLPVYRGEIQAPSLGMDIRILDENGVPDLVEQGDLVLANPYPGCLIGVLHDEDKLLMKKIYLDKYPGYWYVGDEARINPITKGLVVYGRSDETMNRNGLRSNCAEIYFALEDVPDLLDSVCTSQYNSKMDERIILFVKVFPGHSLTPELEDRIRKSIERNMTALHLPDMIVEVPDIPYSINGKKLNGLVKSLINKKPVPNACVVSNPSSLQFFETLDLGDF